MQDHIFLKYLSSCILRLSAVTLFCQLLESRELTQLRYESKKLFTISHSAKINIDQNPSMRSSVIKYKNIFCVAAYEYGPIKHTFDALSHYAANMHSFHISFLCWCILIYVCTRTQIRTHGRAHVPHTIEACTFTHTTRCAKT